MDYLLSIDTYVGLSHGTGRPHFSLREYRALLDESDLCNIPHTLIPAVGREGGTEEDASILKLDFRFQTHEDLSQLCNALNGFYKNVFTVLSQRWIHISYLLSLHGIIVSHNTVDLSANGKQCLQPIDVLPLNSSVRGPRQAVLLWNDALCKGEIGLARPLTSITATEHIERTWGSLKGLSKKYQRSMGWKSLHAERIDGDMAKVVYVTYYLDERCSVKRWQDLGVLEDGEWKIAPQFVIWADITPPRPLGRAKKRRAGEL